MPEDRPDVGDGLDRPLTPEREILESRAERDALRVDPENWPRLDPTSRSEVAGWDRDPPPLTEEQRSALRKADQPEQPRVEATERAGEEPEQADKEAERPVADGTERSGAAEDAAEPESAEGGDDSKRPSEDDGGSGDEASDVDSSGDSADPAANETRRDPEQLHRFGNKERPSPVRIEADLDLESPDAIIGPYAPEKATDEVNGASTFIDPMKAKATGQYHRLPPDYVPPAGLAIHADGKDAGGTQPWGHRTIYPTEPMTAGEFVRRVAELPWQYVGKKK